MKILLAAKIIVTVIILRKDNFVLFYPPNFRRKIS